MRLCGSARRVHLAEDRLLPLHGPGELAVADHTRFVRLFWPTYVQAQPVGTMAMQRPRSQVLRLSTLRPAAQ